MNKKFWIKFGVVTGSVLAIAVIAGLLIWVIRKTAIPREVNKVDVSGWEVHENEELGLSFGHPKDWSVFEKGGEIILRPKEHVDLDVIKFTFDFDDYRGKKTADYWKKEERARVFLLNERKFVRTDSTQSKLGTVAFFDEGKNQHIFIFVQNENDEKLSDESVEAYNGILKTIKWDGGEERVKKQTRTDEIQSIQDLIDGEYEFKDIDTSDWKEYKDDYLGFSVKIPENWYGAQWSKGHCFREEGKDYFFENREVCAIYIGNHYRYSPLEDMSFRERIMKLKEEGSQVLSVNVDDSPGVVASKGFADANFFEGDNAWSISSDLSSDKYPAVLETYSGILKTFRFID